MIAGVDFSGIGRRSILGRVLRLPLRALPARAVLPVLQGPARGLRWVTGSATHGFWLGSYEAEKQEAIARELRPGATFWDVGANVGFYSLLACRLVGSDGQVVAVEPVPRNLEFLRRHLLLNGLESRVQILEGALGDRDGAGGFDASSGFSEGRLSASGETSVAVRSIDSLVQEGWPLPQVIKIDVEGGELDVLQGGTEALGEARPLVFLATHGDEIRESCVRWLKDHDYRIEPLDGSGELGDELVARPAGSAKGVAP